MALKTKTTFATFFGLLIFHELVSGAPLRVRICEWVVLVVAFLIPAILIHNRTTTQKVWISILFFSLGFVVQFVGVSLVVSKFELNWNALLMAPVLFFCFSSLQILNEAILLLVKKLVRQSKL
jgi:uncharacterized membrane protein YqaE (UPF0057 family)